MLECIEPPRPPPSGLNFIENQWDVMPRCQIAQPPQPFIGRRNRPSLTLNGLEDHSGHRRQPVLRVAKQIPGVLQALLACERTAVWVRIGEKMNVRHQTTDPALRPPGAHQSQRAMSLAVKRAVESDDGAPACGCLDKLQ